MGVHDWKFTSSAQDSHQHARCLLLFFLYLQLFLSFGGAEATLCTPPVESQGKFFVMSPNFPQAYPPVVNCSWLLASNASVSWKVQIPCERLRPVHRLVVSFNDSSGTRQSLKLAHHTETAIPTARFQLMIDTEESQKRRTYRFAPVKRKQPPFFFTVVAWTVVAKSPKEENVSKFTASSQSTTSGPIVTAAPRPLCDHAVMVNRTIPLKTGSACQSSQWRIKLVHPIRVLKLVFASNLKDFSLVAQRDARQICSSTVSRCPKVTFVSQAVVLTLNRSIVGSPEVDVQLVPDSTRRCASLNVHTEEVGFFDPPKEAYEVGDKVSFVCPPGFSLPQRHSYMRKCNVLFSGTTEWSDANRPTCFAECKASFEAASSERKIKFQCPEGGEQREKQLAAADQSCEWNISTNASYWIVLKFLHWRDPANNNSLVVEPGGPLTPPREGSSVQRQVNSTRCTVRFFRRAECALEMSYMAIAKMTDRKQATLKATKANAHSGTLTASVVIPMLLLALGILAVILIIRRSLQRKPYTSPFRHFVPAKGGRRTAKSDNFDVEIDITKPNFPPSPHSSRAKSSRLGFGRHSLRTFSARLSRRLRRSSASIGRRLSMSLSGSSRVFFRRSSAPTSGSPEPDADSEVAVASGHSNPALNIQENIAE